MNVPIVSCNTRKHANKLVYTLNKMNLKLRDGQTLLHLAVNGVTPVDDFHTSDVCRFPCVDTVKLLLECGASVSVMDCSRNSPLHTLTATVCMNGQCEYEWITIECCDKSNHFDFIHRLFHSFPNSCNRFERPIHTSISIISKKLRLCSSKPAFTWTLLMSKVSQPPKYVHHVSVHYDLYTHSPSSLSICRPTLQPWLWRVLFFDTLAAARPMINSQPMNFTFFSFLFMLPFGFWYFAWPLRL